MTASSGEIAVLVGYMPHVVRSGTVNEWERKFCASIIARSRKGPLNPTEKQLAVMRRIVKRFQNEKLTDDTPPIEEGS